MANGKQGRIKDLPMNEMRRNDDQSELLQLVPKKNLITKMSTNQIVSKVWSFWTVIFLIK
jgi:hypothetical protein